MGQQVFQMVNQSLQLADFFLQVLNLQVSEPLQLHIDDCLSLLVIKIESFFQAELCLLSGFASPDDFDDFVDVVDCRNQSLQDVHSVLCDFEIINRAACDNFVTVIYKMLNQLFESKNLRFEVSRLKSEKTRLVVSWLAFLFLRNEGKVNYAEICLQFSF